MIPERKLSNEAINCAISQYMPAKAGVWVDVSSSGETNSPYLAKHPIFRTQFNRDLPWLDVGNSRHRKIETFLDIGCPALPENCIDLLICSQVIEHMLQPLDAFKSAASIVKPGGIAVFTTVFKFPIHGDVDYYRFTPLALRHMAAHVGLQVIKSFQSGSNAAPGGVGVVCGTPKR